LLQNIEFDQVCEIFGYEKPEVSFGILSQVKYFIIDEFNAFPYLLLSSEDVGLGLDLGSSKVEDKDTLI
jgi:hypothetical protein